MNDHVKSPLKDVLNTFFNTRGYINQEIEKEKTDKIKKEDKSSDTNKNLNNDSREM